MQTTRLGKATLLYYNSQWPCSLNNFMSNIPNSRKGKENSVTFHGYLEEEIVATATKLAQL